MDYGWNFFQENKKIIYVSIGCLLILSLFIFIFKDFNLRSPTDPEPGCVIMKDRGYYEDSINIVFLPENYNDLPEYVVDTEIMMDTFLETTPYNMYADRFNFFRIESFVNLGCEYSEGAVVCDPGVVKEVSSICPYDIPIVLTDTNGVRSFFQHLRSSAWRGIASVNAKDDPLVFPHEFAHIFAGLLDEYTWPGGRILFSGPNCDTDFQNCNKFKIIDGTECHIGCVNLENSRSVYVGIMRDYWVSNSYGLFNEYLIEQKILELTSDHSNYLPDGTDQSNLDTDNPTNNANDYLEDIEAEDMLELTGTPSNSLSGNKKFLTEAPKSLVIYYSCYDVDQCIITDVKDRELFTSSFQNKNIKEGQIDLIDDSFEVNFEIGSQTIKQLLTFYAHTEGHDPITFQPLVEDILYSEIKDILIIDRPFKKEEILLKDQFGNLLDSYTYFPINGGNYEIHSKGSKKSININEIVQDS